MLRALFPPPSPGPALAGDSDRPDRWPLALASLAASVVLGAALQTKDGSMHPTGLGLLAVAVVLAAAATVLGSSAAVDRRAAAAVTALLLAGFGFELATLLGAPPAKFLPPGADLAYFRHTLAAAAVLGGTLAVRSDRARLGQVAALVLLHFLAGAWIIASSPSPLIDVFVFQRDAAAALLHGTNPYGITFPDIYGHSPFYGEGVSVNGRVTFGFPYPPLSLFLALPGQLVAGDYRFSQLVAVDAAALLMATARRGRLGAAAAALFLFTPRAFFVLEQGWTEPFAVMLLALVAWTACRRPRALPWALGLLLAVKQTMIFALPLSLLLLPRPLAPRAAARVWAKAVGLAVALTLPFAVTQPHGFFRSVVQIQFLQPMRTDALSFLAWMTAHHRPGPTVLAFLAALAGVALALWRAPRSPAGFAAGIALTYVLFFAFNKQAFCNYYFFVIGSFAVAAAVSRPPRSDADGEGEGASEDTGDGATAPFTGASAESAWRPLPAAAATASSPALAESASRPLPAAADAAAATASSPALAEASPVASPLRRLLPSAAIAAVCLFTLLWPGDAPWINDEPKLITGALDASAQNRFAVVGLEGTHGLRYGPLATWLYQIFLVFSHDMRLLLVVRALAVMGGAALALRWLARTLGASLWLVPLTLLSPYLWLYSRHIWDNSFCIPLSALALGAYGRFLTTRSPAALRVTLVCLVALPLIHLMSLAMVGAVAAHLLLFERAELKRRWRTVAAVLAGAALLAGPYAASVLTTPRTGSTLRFDIQAALFPLLGGRYLSAAGLGYFFEKGWQALAPVPALAWAAWALSLAGYPLFWAGLALGVRRCFRALRARAAGPADHVVLIALGVVVAQAGLDGLTGATYHPHYFNATWCAYVVLAWLPLQALLGHRVLRFAPAAFGVSLAVVVVSLALGLHEHGGTRDEHYGATLANQIEIARALAPYAPATAPPSDVPNVRKYPQAIATLRRLEGAAANPLPLPPKLRVVWASPDPDDGRVILEGR